MKISIVTPTWNQKNFIERTIESIIKQKGDFELEYIIMDGGSTDGTVEILKKYEQILKDKKYSHITYIWKSEKDKGQSDAINKGMKMVTGDIAAFMNSDDTYTEDTFAKIVDVFENNSSVRWVFGKVRIINENDLEISKAITLYKNILLNLHSVPLLLAENYISQPATFWRREVLDEVGLFNEEEHLVMDYEYWLRIVTKYGDGYFLNDYLANFRYYDTSKSGSRFKEQFRDELRVARKYGMNYPLSILLHEFNRIKIITAYTVINFAKRLIKK